MNVFNKLTERYEDAYTSLSIWVNTNMKCMNEYREVINLPANSLSYKEAKRLKNIIKALFLERGDMEEVRSIWNGLTNDECFCEWYKQGDFRESKCKLYTNCRNCEIDTMIECL